MSSSVSNSLGKQNPPASTTVVTHNPKQVTCKSEQLQREVETYVKSLLQLTLQSEIRAKFAIFEERVRCLDTGFPNETLSKVKSYIEQNKEKTIGQGKPDLSSPPSDPLIVQGLRSRYRSRSPVAPSSSSSIASSSDSESSSTTFSSSSSRKTGKENIQFASTNLVESATRAICMEFFNCLAGSDVDLPNVIKQGQRLASQIGTHHQPQHIVVYNQRNYSWDQEGAEDTFNSALKALEWQQNEKAYPIIGATFRQQETYQAVTMSKFHDQYSIQVFSPDAQPEASCTTVASLEEAASVLSTFYPKTSGAVEMDLCLSTEYGVSHSNRNNAKYIKTSNLLNKMAIDISDGVMSIETATQNLLDLTGKFHVSFDDKWVEMEFSGLVLYHLTMIHRMKSPSNPQLTDDEYGLQAFTNADRATNQERAQALVRAAADILLDGYIKALSLKEDRLCEGYRINICLLEKALAVFDDSIPELRQFSCFTNQTVENQKNSVFAIQDQLKQHWYSM